MIPIKPTRHSITIYHLENGKAPFIIWMKDLDGSIRARINARIARFQDGLFGDHKIVGDGVLEARFIFGAGYRLYFSILGDEIILLLTGGDKSTQADDVILAKVFLKSYLEGLYANKK
jgi:putative addiction module killer protein